MHRVISKNARIFSLWAAVGVVLLWPVILSAEVAKPADAEPIQSKLQAVINYLDSPQYSKLVSWNEHVVLAYRLTRGRAPTAFEFYLLGMLRDDIGFPRSAVLSVALRGKKRYPSWSQCRNFTRRVAASDFRSNKHIKKSVRGLARKSRRQILNQIKKKSRMTSTSGLGKASSIPHPPACADYNIYFGYLHAHSHLSLDAEGDPLEAYEFARDVAGMDFFALTDHGEYLIIWPWQDKWQQLIDAAEESYIPGQYATLWGFEWSNPLLGHINVLNTDDFTQTFSTFGVTQIYDWLINRPDGFGRFNHPGEYDYLFLEFLHFRLYPEAVRQMVGVENYNGNDGFDHYYYSGSWWSFIPFSYWDVGNLRGWYLGSLGGQDNHSKRWGTRNQFRTAVLAEELTREAIIDAYMNRRFYATEDKNLHLDFRCQGYPMGSRLSGVLPEFEVKAWDDAEDTFREVRLYRDGKILETKVVSGNDIEVWFEDPTASGPHYYYVIISQNDDNDANGRNDEAISSPFWIEN
jgi:hypothetical protein